jgi:hypothetical protein
MGNQPHMRAHAARIQRYPPESDGVFGLRSAEEYMGATLTFVDADHLKADWQQFQGGSRLASRRRPC